MAVVFKTWAVVPEEPTSGLRSPPTVAELWTWLGWSGTPDADQTAQAQAHLDRAAVMVQAYTRGRGFERDTYSVNPDEKMDQPLVHVVLSAAGRSLSNPSGATRLQAGQYSEMPGPDGWLLHERLILDNYRRKAA